MASILLLNLLVCGVPSSIEMETKTGGILGIPVFASGHSDQEREILDFTVDIEPNLRPVKEMSLCLWLKPFRFNFASVVFSITPYTEVEDIFELRMRYDTLFGKILPSDDIKLLAYEWQHLCILFHEDVSLFFEGKENIIDSKEPLIMEDKLFFTLGTDSFVETSFSGLVADIRLYYRILKKKEIMQIATLTDVETDYIVVGEKQLLNNLSFHAGETHESLFFLKRADLLKNLSDINLFYDDNLNECESAKEMCEVLGGRLPFFNSSEDLESIAKLIIDFSTSQEKKIENFWLLKMENETDTCFETNFDNEEKRLKIKNAGYDEKTKLKLICFLRKSQIFNFKIDDVIFRFMKLPNANLEFEDLMNGVQMVWLDSLVSVTSLNRYAPPISRLTVNGIRDVIGRKAWYLEEQKKQVTFSICSDNQFTCTSGICIEIDKICDFSADCADRSDEAFCDVGVEPPLTYDKRLAPTRDRESKCYLFLDIRLYEVNEVSMQKGTITLTLKLTAKWKDPRLRFKNLVSNKSRNIDEKTVKEMWHPPIILHEGIGKDIYLFYMPKNSWRVSALRLEEGQAQFFSGHEVFMNEGSTVMISHEVREVVSVACRMNLFRFPFDTQICNFTLGLHGIIHKDVEWFSHPNIYVVKDHLPLYSNLKLNAFLSSEYSEQMVLTISFKRKNGAYILTTFLPSVIMASIGLLTLLLPTESYSDRVTVTLSCLIVMAAFFTQVSTSLSTSADPKLIDIWMFTHVSFLFIIFLVHVIIIHFHQNYTNSKEKIKKELTRRKNQLRIIKLYSSVEPNDMTSSGFWSFEKKEPLPVHTKWNIFGLFLCITSYVALLVAFFVEVHAK